MAATRAIAAARAGAPAVVSLQELHRKVPANSPLSVNSPPYAST
jgi:hypothetical protein